MGALQRMFAIIVLFTAQTSAQAGWFTMKNDTNSVLIVQELDANQKAGKPQRLYPGEVARTASLSAPSKALVVYDAKQPQHPLYRGVVQCSSTNPTVTFKMDGGVIRVISTK